MQISPTRKIYCGAVEESDQTTSTVYSWFLLCTKDKHVNENTDKIYS